MNKNVHLVDVECEQSSAVDDVANELNQKKLPSNNTGVFINVLAILACDESVNSIVCL